MNILDLHLFALTCLVKDKSLHILVNRFFIEHLGHFSFFGLNLRYHIILTLLTLRMAAILVRHEISKSVHLVGIAISWLLTYGVLGILQIYILGLSSFLLLSLEF